MKIYATACSVVGLVRKNNEDNLYVAGEYLSEDTRSADFGAIINRECEQEYFAVCDGMGGESRGEDASLASICAFKRWCAEKPALNDKNYEDRLRKYFADANDSVRSLTAGTDEVCGCTGVVLAITDGTAYYGNVGDSRLYVIRNGRAVQVTHDHTMAQLYFSLGRFTKEQANRSVLRHQLVRFIGAAEKDSSEPHIGRLHDIKNGDRFLLCSDGLTDMLTDEEIARAASAESCEEAVDTLLKKAMDNGGHDNCTIILVQADEMTKSGAPKHRDRFLRLALGISAALVAAAALLLLLVKSCVV